MRNLENQKGQSLIQVMIAVGIMGIIMMAFISMTTSQQRQAKQLSEKLASLDLQRSLTEAIADPTVCTYMLTSSTPPTFDPMAVGTSSSPVFSSITEIPTKGIAGASPVVVADSQTPASPLARQLVVSSIAVNDLVCIPAPCTATTNQFKANIEVSFDSSRLVLSLAPLKFPVIINTSGPANAQTVTKCNSARAFQKSLTLAYLHQYHTDVPLTCALLSGATNHIGSMGLQAACNRWCTSGCGGADPNSACAGVLPGQGYSVGFTAECNQFDNAVTCNCIR